MEESGRGRGGRGRRFDELAVGQHRSAVYQDKLDAVGVLEGLFEGGFVDDALGIEDGDVGVGADADAAFVFEGGGAILQALRGHECHFSQGGHQVEGFFFADVVAEDAGKSALSAWMDFGVGAGNAIAGNHDRGIGDGCASGLLREWKR